MENTSTRSRIVEKSTSLFMHYGIRSVTMDDIARDLGMSKKTLYQEFRNKADIVFAVSEAHFEQEKIDCQAIYEKADNPIHELILLIRWISDMFQELKPNMIFELQKYYPRSWQLMRDFENEYLMEIIIRNLTKGMEAGLYRQEMDPEIIARIRISQITACFDPRIFPPEKYNTAKVVIQGSEIFLHGLVTMKGKKLIYKYLNRSEDE